MVPLFKIEEPDAVIVAALAFPEPRTAKPRAIPAAKNRLVLAINRIMCPELDYLDNCPHPPRLECAWVRTTNGKINTSVNVEVLDCWG